MADQVPYSPSNWNAGDGYAVDPNYLTNTYQLQDNYFGGSGSNADGTNGGFNMLQYAADTSGNYYNPSNNTLGSSLSAVGMGAPTTGLGAAANGVGTLIGAYNNASTDSGSSALSGAASGAIAGAELGSVVPGIGTVVGAVAGGILGGLAGLFGSKSKKKQAEANYNAQIQAATAGEQQKQADYLQNQKLTQAAISPYASSYQPNGYQFKNSLFGGAHPNLPQPQSGQLNIPNQPAQVVGNGIGKPLTANIPGATFTPSAAQPFQAPSASFAPPQAPQTLAMPQYSGNQAQDQANANSYLNQYAKNIQLQNQISAAAAMNPYAAYFGGNANGVPTV